VRTGVYPGRSKKSAKIFGKKSGDRPGFVNKSGAQKIILASIKASDQI
jgi:hypothetical protein